MGDRFLQREEYEDRRRPDQPTHGGQAGSAAENEGHRAHLSGQLPARKANG